MQQVLVINQVYRPVLFSELIIQKYNISVRMNMFEFKCEQLEKEVFMLKQELEFRSLENADYAEREAQLKKVNESLMKALEQQKPNNATLTEIKLMVERYGGGQKEKALQAELERLKRNLDNEVQERVRGIVIESELKLKSCSRCRELDFKISQLDLQNSKLKSKINTQIQYSADIQSKYRNAMDQLQAKHTKLLNTQMQFRRYRQENEVERQFERKRSTEEKNTDQQVREKLSRELEVYQKELTQNFNKTIEEKTILIQNQVEEKYKDKIVQLQRRLQTTKYRREEETSKRSSQMTPVKTLTYHEHTETYHHTQDFNLKPEIRSGVSPTWRKQNKNFNSNMSKMGQIKEIIGNLTRNKPEMRGRESQISQISGISGYNENGGFCFDDDGSEYSNFSIKEAINRPNNLLENHHKLKNRYN